MSVDDDSSAGYRSTGSYRAAIWITRLNVLTLLAWLWLAATSSSSEPAIVGVWLLGLVGVGSAFVLMHRAGVPFRRGRDRASRAEIRRMQLEMLGDVVGIRRP